MVAKSFIADKIQRDIDKKYSKMGNLSMRNRNAKVDDMRSCICLICKTKLDLLTHVHAEKHGYKCKEDMVADKKVKWL